MTLKQLEKRVAAMEQRLTALEKRKRRANGNKPNAIRKTRKRRTLRSTTLALTEQEKQKRVLELLRAKGMISEPTEREKQIAAEWMARPEEERERLLKSFRESAPNVSLADIVINNRR